jgi:hypothetical protein
MDRGAACRPPSRQLLVADVGPERKAQMVITEVEDLLASHDTMRLSEHALYEAYKESLRARDIFHAIFNGKVLEHYPRRHRVLIVGPTIGFDLRIHVVCEYADRDEIVAITVYIPDRPRWATDWLRA